MRHIGFNKHEKNVSLTTIYSMSCFFLFISTRLLLKNTISIRYYQLLLSVYQFQKITKIVILELLSALALFLIPISL